jgi:MFS family permease
LHPSTWRLSPPSEPWGAVVILTTAYLLSMLDRQFLAVAVVPVQAELGLSDVEIALLTGFAFAACYSLTSIPISHYADRYHRPAIIAGGILLWSLATAASGLVDQFAGMFVARMAVGIGEAALLPAAYSLMGDLFRRERLPAATGVFATGGALGAGLAFIAGGLMLAHLPDPGFLGLSPWRQAFLLMGALGVGVAAIVLLIGEPRRDRPQRATESGAREVWEAMCEDRAFLLTMGFAGIAATSFAYGFVAWVPAYFDRVHGLSPATVGSTFGVAVLLSGLVASPLWGIVGARVAARGREPAFHLLPGVSLGLLMLAGVGPLMPTPALAMIAMGLVPLATAAFTVLVPAAIVARTRPAHRSRVTALFLASVNLVGISIGPLLYALVTERLPGGPDRIAVAMSLVSACLVTVLVAVLVAGRRAARTNLTKDGIMF